jgi:hypothetical protein
MSSYPVYISGISSVPVSSGNIYYVIGDSEIDSDATSATAGAITYHSAGTLSKLTANVYVNTATAGPCTVKSYIAGSLGNQLLSFAAGITGFITDGADTDSISSGNTVELDVDNSDSTGTATFSSIMYLFTGSTNTVKRIASGNNELALSSASITRYIPAFGTNIASTTELYTETMLFVNGTLSNSSVVVDVNGRSHASTVVSRIGTGSGQSTGNASISITASTTGTFSDTTDSDTLANTGTTINWMVTTGTGSGTTDISSVSAEVITTDGTSVAGSCIGTQTGFPSTGKYIPFAGGTADNFSTESNCQVKAAATYVVSNASINITSNAGTTASTLQFRLNGANANNAASITASTTGFYTDASDTDSLTSTSLIDYELIRAASGTVDFVSISAKLSQPAGAPGMAHIPDAFMFGQL